MIKRIIYADNAATTKLDAEAFEAMKPFLLESFANPSQPYLFSHAAKEAIKTARQTIAACIHAEPEEIFFTSGGTESNNWAIKGIALFNSNLRETLTTQIEHHAVLRACEALEKLGFPVAYMRVSSEGVLSPEMLRRYVTEKTNLVSVMYANNEIGSIQPIHELCSVAHDAGALFHTDAVQAVGHCHIDVKELGIDMLSASAHKFNGPKGIGFLYVKNGTQLRPIMSGGSQEAGMRAGTENVASIIAMASALCKNCSHIEETQSKLRVLEKILLNRLKDASVSFMRNGSENHLAGHLNLSFKYADGEALLHRLDLMGICVSTGAACDSKSAQISHVLRAVNLDERYAKGSIRITFGRDNTQEDAACIADALISILTR